MREYRFTTGRRWGYGILGLIFAAPAVVCLVWSCVAHLPAVQLAGAAALSLGFGLLGVGCTLSAVRSRITLFDDAIERQGAFRRRRMNVADIAGRRSEAAQGASFIRLVSRTPGVRDLRLERMFATDAAFDAWMQRLPDLDAQELARSQAEYVADEDHRAPHEEKLRRLRSAQRIARYAQYATFAVVAWGFMYPHPYDLLMLVLAAMPVVIVGIAVTGRGAYTLEGRRNDVRANLALPLIMPGMVLLLRAVIDLQVLDWQALLWLAALVTALGAALLLWASPDFRRSVGGVVTAAFLLCAWGYGVTAQLNVQLDRAAPGQFAVQVLDRHLESGKSTTYYLDVTAWGPRTAHEDVVVSRELYGHVAAGGRVCIYLWPGALGVRWYEVDDCPSG